MSSTFLTQLGDGTRAAWREVEQVSIRAAVQKLRRAERFGHGVWTDDDIPQAIVATQDPERTRIHQAFDVLEPLPRARRHTSDVLRCHRMLVTRLVVQRDQLG